MEIQGVHRILLIALLFASSTSSAQFNIFEPFTGSEQVSGAYELGDQALLTASTAIDNEGDGWLRLTSATGNQKGYVFLNRAFPSTLGVSIDFEYKIWTDKSTTQADGFSVFLFDADVSTDDFSIGGFGGSLGYANKDGVEGLSGGYIGVGFDVYGNFSNPTEGRVGDKGPKPESIVLRGPTTGDPTTTNKFLKRVDAPAGTPIHYTNVTNNRPDDDDFYRRVRIEIIATDDERQEISVRWKTSIDGEFTELLNYTTDETLPENLKLGFAASTGSSYSTHEIRNVRATTPGNLIVENSTGTELLRAGHVEEDQDKFTYTIRVENDTDSKLTDINFSDFFVDSNGNSIPAGMVEIIEIAWEGFINENLPSPTAEEPIVSGEFSGIIGLEANSFGTITVVGRLLDIPAGYELKNSAEISSESILENDTSNNFSAASIPVLAEGVDLKVELVPDDYCLDENGNLVNLRVSNLGEEAANFVFNSNGKINNKIWIEFEFPDNISLDFSGLDTNKWYRDDSFYAGNKILFLSKEEGNFQGKTRLSDLPIRITPNEGVTSYEIKVKLSFLADNEPVEVNLNNNEHLLVISEQVPPTVDTGENSELIYCQGVEASQLTAEVREGNELLWYDSQGNLLSGPPTPETQQVGSTTYYVSQTNGYCESSKTEIMVTVLGTEAGIISGADSKICKGSFPIIMGSDEGVDWDSDIKTTYRWQYSTDGGNTWSTPKETDVPQFRIPVAVQEEVLVERIVVQEKGEVTCKSRAIFYNVQPVLCTIMVNPALPSNIKR